MVWVNLTEGKYLVAERMRQGYSLVHTVQIGIPSFHWILRMVDSEDG